MFVNEYFSLTQICINRRKSVAKNALIYFGAWPFWDFRWT